MLKMEMNVVKRDKQGSKACGRLRKEGFVPAVVYGAASEPVSIAVRTTDFLRATATKNMDNVLLTLNIEGVKEKKLAILRDIQKNAITGQLVHIDFNEISMDKNISTHLHVELVGESEGVKLGGVLEFQSRSLDVSCKPNDLPDHIEVDITKLAIGESLHVSDLKVSDKIRITTNSDVVIVAVKEPVDNAAIAAEVSEDVTEAEPEVIKKGKKEEEID